MTNRAVKPEIFESGADDVAFAAPADHSGGCGVILLFTIGVVFGTVGSVWLCTSFNPTLVGGVVGLLLPYLAFQNGAAAVGARLFGRATSRVFLGILKRAFGRLLSPVAFLFRRTRQTDDHGSELHAEYDRMRGMSTASLLFTFAIPASLTIVPLVLLLGFWGADPDANTAAWVVGISVYEFIVATSGIGLVLLVRPRA